MSIVCPRVPANVPDLWHRLKGVELLRHLLRHPEQVVGHAVRCLFDLRGQGVCGLGGRSGCLGTCRRCLCGYDARAPDENSKAQNHSFHLRTSSVAHRLLSDIPANLAANAARRVVDFDSLRVADLEHTGNAGAAATTHLQVIAQPNGEGGAPGHPHHARPVHHGIRRAPLQPCRWKGLRTITWHLSAGASKRFSRIAYLLHSPVSSAYLRLWVAAIASTKLPASPPRTRPSPRRPCGDRSRGHRRGRRVPLTTERLERVQQDAAGCHFQRSVTPR